MDYEFMKRTFVEFRQKMGLQEWMLDEQKRTSMIRALIYAVANCEVTDAQRRTIGVWMDATAEEFSRRCLYVDLRKDGAS